MLSIKQTIFNSKLLLIGVFIFIFSTSYCQSSNQSAELQKAEAEQEQKANEWVNSLNLNDEAKENRLAKVIAEHLMAVRTWHNEHSPDEVPEGINPYTGKTLSKMDRQIIVDSALPKSVHENLMNGLRQDLIEEQVEAILDKYTVGKVAFTMKGYKAIVPDLTAEEEAVILKNLKAAREQAVDFKNMKEISAIFEIYKTQNENYLNMHGRNWHQMYKDYTNKRKAEKAKSGK